VGAFGTGLAVTSQQLWRSTRVEDVGQHARTGDSRYPYRAKSEFVLRELDLRAGDVVVDIGAGDGWWSEQMAAHVGPRGVVHASEVEQRKVDQMQRRFADTPQVKPYLSPREGTGLPENSCDLAFLSQTFHHLDKPTRVEYLRRLKTVVKPTGRFCVIEKYSAIATRGASHGTSLSQLVQEAERAGWIPVRYELMTGTYHYLAIFVKKDLFGPER
jgi:ubiquinone/menaquinone biosynthesis C-methylase UbiE